MPSKELRTKQRLRSKRKINERGMKEKKPQYTKKDFQDIKCRVCGNDFRPKSKAHLCCSRQCALQHMTNNKTHTVLRDLSPGTVGAISELVVAVDLMKKGWDVFRALSPSSDCDLIAIKNDSILKIEVRTGFYFNGQNGELRLSYSRLKTSGKTLAVLTNSDNKVHYIGIDI